MSPVGDWLCAGVAAGSAATPADLDPVALQWFPVEIPGTAASALAAAGLLPTQDRAVLDGQDWWFRTELHGGGRQRLRLGGLATLADVWLDGTHLLRGENMFTAYDVDVDLDGTHELTIRCASLDAALAGRHPRPRWKSRLVGAQSLRWYRTSLLGRMPSWSARAAPVGPWRPVTLEPLPTVTSRWLTARCAGAGGEVEVRLRCAAPTRQAVLHVGGYEGPLTAGADGTLVGTVSMPAVDRWWPHGYGPQPRYDVAVVIDGETVALGRVGFRDLAVDRTGDGFAVVVNGVPVFCRGALWNQPDTVGFTAAGVREDLARCRELGFTMLRIAGWSTYQDEVFWDACDELGILVWQDVMIASVDAPPELPVAAELEQQLGALQGRPALAVVCGSAESHQQAAMLGLGTPANPLLSETIPAAVERLLPGTAYVPSSPSGGDPPFTPDTGVGHYFGVGAFLRPLADARAAGVRFASECLGFSIPPERSAVEEWFGGSGGAGHHPAWKAGVGRDGGASWDFEDVTGHYVREIFGVTPFEVRYADPDLALDHARAAVAEAMGTVLGGWRRTGSGCGGGLILTWRDAWPGAGWGLLDAAGRLKAPAYALRRVCAPTALWFSSDGLAGLRLHLAHDGPAPLATTLRLRLHAATGAVTETVEQAVAVPAHGQVRLGVDALFGGFRDLGRAYRFVPAAIDVVHAEADGVGEAVFLPGGAARPRLPSVGLRAVASEGPAGWELRVSTALFAQWVAVHTPGVEVSDSWFHLPPGATRTVTLGGRPTRGSVRALNAVATAPIELP